MTSRGRQYFVKSIRTVTTQDQSQKAKRDGGLFVETSHQNDVGVWILPIRPKRAAERGTVLPTLPLSLRRRDNLQHIYHPVTVWTSIRAHYNLMFVSTLKMI